MTQIPLDFDLTSHLFFYPPLLDLILMQHLEYADKPTVSLPNQKYSPKLFLAQGPTELEHAEMESPGDWLFEQSDVLLLLPLYQCIGRL